MMIRQRSDRGGIKDLRMEKKSIAGLFKENRKKKEHEKDNDFNGLDNC